MTMYIEFCKVVLIQSVSQLGENQVIIHSGKISKIIVIKNIAI